MALDSLPNPAADPTPAPAGGVIYPVCDDMGETGFHHFATNLLIELLSSYLAALDRPAFVRGNQFFYYKKGDPRAVVAPDVYVVEGDARHPTQVDNWKTWEPDEGPPVFALEIVSEVYRKDYADSFLERYQQLGVRELVRYDPRGGHRRKREVFAHFVRDDQGQLVRRPVFGERIHLASYEELWLVRHAGDVLRIAVGPKGSVLWPTAAERADAEAGRAAAEAERAAAEAERATAEAERADAEAERAAAAEARAAAAEARAAAALAELEALRAAPRERG